MVESYGDFSRDLSFDRIGIISFKESCKALLVILTRIVI